MAPIVSVAIGHNAPARAFSKPPANGRLDYQLGGAYTPAADVAIVVRDRLEEPAAGKYNICYVNAFQTQPGDAVWWRKNHPDLLVKKDGKYVVDPNWPDEHILDISTTAKRAALMDVVGPWIDKCASDGFKAIEPDNLDSWVRSKGVLTPAANLAFAELLVQRAHKADLAIGQKNAAELAEIGAAQIGFDFAIAEECQVWSECQVYSKAYGNQVYEIEYGDNDRDPIGNAVDPVSYFNTACQAQGTRISVIYRDRDVVPAGTSGYVYRAC
ncbi:endo alpha-1,4 polygalactosaminidase [Ensifer adhaerens]|uniref:endo alpha-1,4 polygalactosaminidase n=1 Tax=Ensifer adhaerens TaxID=106592 RepID=UPI0015C3D302|nr:endo alpha-1,4 polygalactosaminidase [Ensifer adhaerens]